jgi:hypothetical protein
MTFADLFTTLETHGLPRAKDCKTALRLLATALGYPSMEACPVEAACREEATWGTALDAHFQQLQTQGRIISGGNRRNIRSNLRTVFKVAAAHGLLETPLPAPLLTKPRRSKAYECQQQLTAPYRATYASQTGPRHFWLPQAQWPDDVQDGWRAYQAHTWHRLRETTFQAYARTLMSYLGYLANICGRTPVWDDCFDVAQLREFVRWHGVRVGRPPVSIHGRYVVITLAAIAKVLKHPHAREVADFRNTLKPPAPLHNKRAHWVSLAELEAVADACIAEGRLPVVPNTRARSPGVYRTCRFQRGLMLKLLTRLPLRQRNLRELQDKHLYQEQDGHWELVLRGDDLKIGTRQGRVNEYRVNLSEYAPELVELIEEFFRVHRPRVPGAATSPYIFLTQSGRPHSMRSLWHELAYDVRQRTGKRFYPHLVRSVWATEYLTATQDYATAATMLGDTLAVVMKTYYDIVHKDQQAKAKAFLGGALRRTG